MRAEVGWAGSFRWPPVQTPEWKKVQKKRVKKFAFSTLALPSPYTVHGLSSCPVFSVLSLGEKAGL
jgi:hypothetical protein